MLKIGCLKNSIVQFEAILFVTSVILASYIMKIGNIFINVLAI